ncbi:class I SAM-dependent methyltransferase [Rothia amarae]|nr:class I SAM-dependent methyltransferase [Rothia amarae]
MHHRTTSLERTTEAYNQRATAYTNALGNINSTSPIDQSRISQWATNIHGRICDLGCGPGHWTHFLHETGASVVGYDPSDQFVDIASSKFPYLNFHTGTARDLPPAHFGGILTWYSLIHTAPEHLNEELSFIAKALSPGGSLLMGFFTGDDILPFNHAISQGWFYPIDFIRTRLQEAGFTVQSSSTRKDEGARAHGDIHAVLTS